MSWVSRSTGKIRYVKGYDWVIGECWHIQEEKRKLFGRGTKWVYWTHGYLGDGRFLDRYRTRKEAEKAVLHELRWRTENRGP